MGLLDRLSGQPTGDTRLDPDLAHLVANGDEKLRGSVLRDQRAILASVNPGHKVTFLGRATSSDASTVESGSTVFVTTQSLGYARKGRVVTAFPIKQVTRANGSYESRMRCYRVGVMADRMGTGLMIDFDDQKTQLAFMRAIGYEPA
jgi:hypothetical protein